MRRALIVGAMFAIGCDRKPLGSPSEAPTATSSAPLTAEAYELAGRPTIDAATAVVAACRLVPTEPAGWFDYVTYDECTWKKQEVERYVAASNAVEVSFAHEPPGPWRLFAGQAALFRDWLRVAIKTETTRGTLRLYQDVAKAWNLAAPAKPIATEPPNVLRQYFENMDDTERDPTTHFVDYVWRSGHRYDAHKAKGTPLEWHESAQGPFLAN